MEKTLSNPIEQQLIDAIVTYPFSASPFQIDLKPEELNLTSSDLKGVVEEIQIKILNYLLKKRDESVFHLVQSKLKTPDGKEFKTLDEFIKEGEEVALQMKLLDVKTLQNCFTINDHHNTYAASRNTINILKAFHTVVESERINLKELERVAGWYNVYNCHNLSEASFQVSNIYISKNDNNHLIHYKSRRFTDEKQPISVKIIGKNKLWITHEREDCLLSFYGFIGALNNPEIIQMPFFYNNELGHTLSTIAVFERVDSKNDLIKPDRELTTIPYLNKNDWTNQEKAKIIENYLTVRGQVLSPKLSSGFDFKQPARFNLDDLKIYPGPYPNTIARFYENASLYIGDYYIYFNEWHSSKKDHKSNNFCSTVGKGLLQIYKDEKSGVLKCRMKTLKNKHGQVLTHEGLIMNDKLRSSAYLIINLYSTESSDRFLNLILRQTSEDLLMGSHNIMYSVPGKLGAGSSILMRIRNEKFKYDDIEPNVLGHEDYSNMKSGREKQIFNYLSNTNLSNTFPISEYDSLKKFNELIYKGIYRMYSTAVGVGIRVNYIKLHENGFTEYLGISGNSNLEAVGYTFLLRSVLYMTLSNTENDRTGYCCIKVLEIPPTLGTLYVGTFCGVTRRFGEYPLAAKIILEYLGTEGTLNPKEKNNGIESKIPYTPEIIKYEDRERLKPIAPIVNSIKNEHDSFIGFLGKKNNIFSLEDLQEYNENQTSVSIETTDV